MLTRRDFHKTLTALALTSVAGAARSAASSRSDASLVVLNRLTFGATEAAEHEIADLGIERWIDTQLALPATDPDLQKRLAGARLLIEYEAGKSESGKPWPAVSEHRPLGFLDTDPAGMLYLLDFDEPLEFSERERPASEVVAASLIRAVHGKAQLREVMTGFWHEHFSVNAFKDELTAVFFPSYDAILREHALGNFRQMLGQVARAPSMLVYLNNDSSRASPANENYARELMELHTLGQENYFNDIYDNWHMVPGAEAGLAEGYIDEDVYEVARAFTGWSIGDGREVSEGKHAPETGRFAYIEAWHDPYQKRILGREFAANSGPMKDGEAVLDILAAHPGTARFLSAKMLRRLGVEAPSDAYLADVAAVFHDQRDAPDQIARTVRAITTHPEFLATPPIKLRRPFEFLTALLRRTGAETSPRDEGFYWMLARAGWTQHRVRPPTGHSDHSADWANTRTIGGLVDLALEAHSEWIGLTDRPLSRAPDGVTNYAGLAQFWEARFAAPPGSISEVLSTLEMADEPLPDDDPDEMDWVSSGLVTALALRPEILFR